LKERGLAAEAAAWDDPGVEWAAYDLAVLRSAWDYHARLDDFLAWARSVPRLANPAAAVEWNTDKRYLRDLAAAGVPVVPTTWVEPGGAWTPPAEGLVVVKPAVSAGGLDSGRYDLSIGQDVGHAKQTSHAQREDLRGRAAGMVLGSS